MNAFIKQFDVFGHPITLNLHQSKGAAHKTLLGGIVTVIMKTALFIIFCMNIAALFANQYSKMNSQLKLRTVEDLKEVVSYKDTGVMNYISILGKENG